MSYWSGWALGPCGLMQAWTLVQQLRCGCRCWHWHTDLNSPVSVQCTFTHTFSPSAHTFQCPVTGLLLPPLNHSTSGSWDETDAAALHTSLLHGSLHKLLLSCFLVHPLMQPLPCLMFSTCTLFIYLAWALSVECHEKYNRRSPVPVAHSVRLAVDVYIRFLMLNSFCRTVYSHANKQPVTVPNNIRSSYSLQCSFIRKLD